MIIISGFPPDKIQCDQLFFLFSNFGQVIRIKILNSKDNTALIQFQDSQQASQAMNTMNHARIFGNTVDINISKHSFIRPPLAAADGGDGKTVDYEHSPLNRYGNSQYSQTRNVAPPTNTLHISNLSPSTTQETLTTHLSQAGEVEGIKLFDNTSTSSGSGRAKYMALVQYHDAEVAIEAMCLLHNSVVDGQNIRLSFTRSKI